MSSKNWDKYYRLDFSKITVMKKSIYILVFVNALLINASLAQKGKIDKALKYHNTLSYVQSSAMLLKLVNDGNRSPEVLQNLANAYYLNGKMKSASQWYSELLGLNQNLDFEIYFRYAQSLKAVENYAMADKIMLQFNQLNPEDSRAKAFLLQPNYLKDIRDLSQDFALKNLDVNTEYSDFGTAVFNSEIYFASARGDGQKYSWNAQAYLDIYSVNDALSTEILALQGDVNTKYHESSVVFSKDGTTMYFARNNYYKGSFKKDSKNTHNLKLYKATLVDGLWTNIESLPFNNDEYNTSHPALNPDGTILYFASDMPGTLGNSDIFMVRINEDGSYSTPENLGAKINTEGRENFPFISDKGTLYFSSDGHVGLGGLDVFEFENIGNITSSRIPVKNIGRPINSPKDDFGYIIDENTSIGYVSSNRKGGKGDDDIYSFNRPIPKQFLIGIVKDRETMKPLSNAQVIVYDAEMNEVLRLMSNEKGQFETELANKKEKYIVVGTLQDYDKDEHYFELLNIKSSSQKSIELLLNLIPKVVAIGTDLTEELELNPINFDFDKSNIRPDAALELAKVIAYMKKYPKLNIDVRSHTDARGNDSYNLALSIRRNKSTVNYIINEGGISSDRLTGKGYGEEAHINKCSNAVKCSKEEHEANRRSEFIVLSN